MAANAHNAGCTLRQSRSLAIKTQDKTRAAPAPRHRTHCQFQQTWAQAQAQVKLFNDRILQLSEFRTSSPAAYSHTQDRKSWTCWSLLHWLAVSAPSRHCRQVWAYCCWLSQQISSIACHHVSDSILQLQRVSIICCSELCGRVAVPDKMFLCFAARKHEERLFLRTELRLLHRAKCLFRALVHACRTWTASAGRR